MNVRRIVHWMYLWQEIGYPLKHANKKVKKEWKRRDLFEDWLSRTKRRSVIAYSNTSQTTFTCVDEVECVAEYDLVPIPEQQILFDHAI